MDQKQATIIAQADLPLFPEIDPYATGFLSVDEPHEIYWEQCGNPDGVPVICLHGGPGGKCNAKFRQYFDPDHYRIILFDQRGAGRSTPALCLENNDPAHLVADIEQLREHLNIEQWHVFGGSWGSTLALLYATDHADKCLSLVLRGIFLMDDDAINWFLYGMGNIFPEAWEEFSSFIPEEERHDLLTAYYKRLTGDNKAEAQNAGISWSLYESACSSLIPNYETITTSEQILAAQTIALIEAHFFYHHKIKAKDSLLNKVDNFRHIPTTIVHGRYDIVCNIKQANALHQKWPEADYVIVPNAGHSMSERGIISRLIEATENMKAI